MKTLPALFLAFSCLASPLLTTSHAQITASFSGGGASGAGNLVTDQVDAYSGKAGLGWADAWTPRRSATVAVVSTNSLAWGTKKRLQITPTHASEFNMNRAYQGIDDPDSGVSLNLTRAFTIAFSFSIDNIQQFLNTSTNHFYLGQQSTTSFNKVGSTIWNLAGFGGGDPSSSIPGHKNAKPGEWNIWKGKENSGEYVPTGILLQQDVLYRFVLNLNPEDSTYTVSITNGTQTFQSDLLVFNNTSETLATSTKLSFAQNYASGQMATYSIGDISITQIPEPSTAYLFIGAAGLGLLGLKRVRGLASRQ